MSSVLPFVQIILSVLLIATILMQRSEAGLGAVFGGGESDTFHKTRRGLEKVLFRATIVIAILFVLSVLASIL